MKQAISLACVLACCTCGAWSQSTVRVSVGPGGAEANYHSLRAALSADGRFVAFESSAMNLLANDLNSDLPDVFVADLSTGALTLVSANFAGLQGNLSSQRPSISADGRFVAFESDAVSLVEGDGNGARDVFVRDMQSGRIVRASVGSAGVEGNGTSSHAVVSDDGRWVAFESDATNLVPDDTNGVRDVFVRELSNGQTRRVSVSSLDAQGDAPSGAPSIAGNGLTVAFHSLASNLVDDDTNGVLDVFVRDLAASTTERASVGSALAQANAASSLPSLSRNGRYVAFESEGTNLVAGDSNGASDVFVHDRLGGGTQRASVDELGFQGDNASLLSGPAQISSDGRFVVFESWAANLVPDDTNQTLDVFVRDLWTGTTERCDVSNAGEEAAAASNAAGLSDDGRRIAFTSGAANLVDGDTNAMWDVFLRDRGLAAPSQGFCFGDGADAGVTSACPCGNFGSGGHGCASSMNASGASLVARGFIAADDIVLLAAGLPRATVCQFLQGDAATDVVFGDGVRCAGGQTVSLRVKASVGGLCVLPGPGDTLPLSTLGGVTVGSGATRVYQVVYRNAAASFCPPGTVNLTNAFTRRDCVPTEVERPCAVRRLKSPVRGDYLGSRMEPCRRASAVRRPSPARRATPPRSRRGHTPAPSSCGPRSRSRT